METVRQIRKVLDALAKVEREDGATKEIVYDREYATIREQNREGIFEAIKVAVGSNSKRRQYSPFIFSALYDVPGIEMVFRELLENADADGRADIIQTIGLRKMRNLVGVLNDHFPKESDDFCRGCLLHTLASIADESSIPIFVYLMHKSDRRDEWRILVAATNFARSEFSDYLVEVFGNEATETSHKVMAAWGLAKLKNKQAYTYLIKMLDDPEIRTANSFHPGHSKRAAQALCDINGWEFEL